ncbi:U3-aranetoxin-Ce1a-like [Centruroides vittatus]|uniref:U3-aranetoxin-Ce1a-like n=1 Tax=Centruroides vittatus TaxID=120091 RepID=UPI00350FCD69
MKCVFLLLGLTAFVGIQVNAKLAPCLGQANCEDDECCVRISGLVKLCQKRVQEDKLCVPKPIKVPLYDEMYVGRCPCAEGLECLKKEDKGLAKFIYTCQAQGEVTTENPEPETKPQPEESEY